MMSRKKDAETKITPAMLFTGIHFGKAEEAINYYASIFDNSSIDSITPYPKENEYAGKIMFATCKLNNYDMIAMDGPGVQDYTFNEAVSLVVECNTQEQIDYYWEKFTQGGQESQYGWLKDKFGVSWQIVPTILAELMGDPSKSQRVKQAFMQMKKFDIEKLLEA
jgi:predicted 3-demethylubiquinone-9 3-methyltransferase (glyoxalase superfamily)